MAERIARTFLSNDVLPLNSDTFAITISGGDARGFRLSARQIGRFEPA